MYEIVVHEDADSEINNAAAFFQLRQDGLGGQFLREVAAAFRRIQSYPFSGSPIFDDFHRRLMRRFPYSIVYRVETEKVFVLAVAHLRRRPMYWRVELDCPPRVPESLNSKFHMRIAIGADHGGYPLNERVIGELRTAGHEITDFGTHDGSIADDYPDYALEVGQAIQLGTVEIGILICGSGVGAAVAANKLKGVRAALCGDTYSAHQSREHDDCNILCLGARVTGVELALEIVRAFVAARFTGEERHRRRLLKVAEMEKL